MNVLWLLWKTSSWRDIFRGLCVFPGLQQTHPTQQQHGKYQEIPKMPRLELRLCSAAYMANASEALNTSRKY